MTETDETAPAEEFLETQEYRRFAEFCDACRRYRYIGLCYGTPGVGKTLSARHYARWDLVGPALQAQWSHDPGEPPAAIANCRTLLYTPSMTATPRRLTDEVSLLQRALKFTVARARGQDEDDLVMNIQTLPERTELLIVDEADRLKFPTLEQLRDEYDRRGFGLVLIGMPGLERRLARYAQFYSRVGFVHQFRALSPDGLRLILTHKWAQLGLTLNPEDVTDAEAIGAILRITSGNFRLIQRLFSQIERIVEINGLRTITPDAVDAARQSLVIGTA
jgi:DNA transposition AAA+ family ATPase